MSNIYDHLPPPTSGDFPDWFKFNTPGDTISGQITDQRIGQPKKVGEMPYPILQIRRSDGTEVSVWPGRWSTSFLQSIRHTRSFLKNYLNDPLGYDGGYWTDDDFQYGTLPLVTRRLLSVDPAVTTKKESDPSAIAIIGSACPMPYACEVAYNSGSDSPATPLGLEPPKPVSGFCA